MGVRSELVTQGTITRQRRGLEQNIRVCTTNITQRTVVPWDANMRERRKIAFSRVEVENARVGSTM